jgi:toxin ParE1/3/4
MRLKVAHAASEDLEGIWLYTAEHWSVEQADRYVNLILDGFEQIKDDPKIGRDFSQVRKGYHCTMVGAHLIFYRWKPGDQEVEIIRVLHGRMNLVERLKA